MSEANGLAGQGGHAGGPAPLPTPIAAPTNGNGSHPLAWWKAVVATLGAALAGALASWTGVNSRLDEHQAAIVKQQVELQHLNQQLDRVEGKMDRLLEQQRMRP